MSMTAPAAPDGPASFVHRLLRGAAFTSGGFVLSQALRFGANLVLARLLFPEAFGLMALMTMILQGLTMLSDTGVQQSIMQHRRGDDGDFLNTAWTLNLARGGALWLLACALAWPVSVLYDAPELLWALPVGGLTLVLGGAAPTKVFTAHRHIRVGRIVMLEFAGQTVGVVCMIGLAMALQSYWAMVAGMLTQSVARLVLEWTVLEGPRNRLRWERAAGGELLRFGGWILLSSAFGFALLQGDRAILGAFLTLDELGVYNIAWFLASAPILLAHAMMSKLLIPAYRESFEARATASDARIRRLRLGLSGGILALLAIMALGGPWLVTLLYDDRYSAAGAIIVMISCVQMLQLVSLTYDQAALAKGDSRRFFRVVALRATVQTAFFLAGVWLAGLAGALLGQALAAIGVYPAIVALARHTRVWDPRHDALIGGLVAVTIAAALGVHGDTIRTLSF